MQDLPDISHVSWQEIMHHVDLVVAKSGEHATNPNMNCMMDDYKKK